MHLNALDLNLVRVFDALMQERSVTRAGERVGLSQPAVSAALNRLRHALNDQLFVRRGNEMLPTPCAEELADLARGALSLIERMVASDRQFEPMRLERTFTLLGADFFSLLLMPRLARRIGGAAPGVRLRFLDSARGDVPRLLQEDAVDVALERPLDVPDWVSSQRIFDAPFVVVGARRNPALAGLPEREVLPLETFCALPHAIRSIDGSMAGMIDQALAATGRARRVTLALPHFQAVALAVADGPQIAAVPVQFADAVAGALDLAVYLPPFEVPAPEIRLYWHARHDGEAAHRWLRGEILAMVDALGFSESEES